MSDLSGLPFVSHLDAVEKAPVAMTGSEGVLRQLVVGPREGWKDYVMRVFTVQAGGHTPLHSHPWPHINYVIQGSGIVAIQGRDYPLREGSVAFVPPGSEHRFTGARDGELVFICIVPPRGDPTYAE